ncbi:hypothetical protein WDW89_17515 [Deltaproteobacteria bacterium TL4]
MTILAINPVNPKGVYSVSGKVVAESDFSALLSAAQDHLVLILKEITEISSLGVKKWTETMQKLREKGKSLEYQECPEIFIEQCNMVSELCEGIKIHSFAVEFVCNDCDDGETRMLKMEELDLNDLPPAVPCPSCQEEMITEDPDVFDFRQR